MDIDTLSPHLVSLLRSGIASVELEQLGLAEEGDLTFEGAVIREKLGIIGTAYPGFPKTCPTCGEDFGAMMMAWGDAQGGLLQCIYCATKE